MVPAHRAQGRVPLALLRAGKAAHSSLTPQAVNAIEAAARVVARIADMADALARQRAAPGRFRRALHAPPRSASSRAASPTTWCPRTAASTTSSATCPAPTPRRMQAAGGGVCGDAWSRRCARSMPTAGFRFEPIAHDAGVPGRRRTSRRCAWRSAWPAADADHAGGLRHRGRAVPARRHRRPWSAGPGSSPRRTRPTST